MTAWRRAAVLSCSLACVAQAAAGAASHLARTAQQQARDGRHDFDFEIGEWTTHLKRLQRPLSGSTTWVEYDGTTTVRGVLDGRANLAELVVQGPAGRIEGAALRLYEPQSRQWTLNFFNIADGKLTPPTVGEFQDCLLYTSDAADE